MIQRFLVLSSVASLAVLVLVLGDCGTTPSTGDAAPDVVNDLLVSDVIVPLDASDAGDATPVDAGFPYPPATWSMRYEHVGYGDIASSAQPLCLAAEGAIGADFGNGALASASAVGVALDADAGLAWSPKSTSVLAFTGGSITGDMSYGSINLDEELNLRTPTGLKSVSVCGQNSFITTPTTYAGPPARYHHATMPGDVRAADGLSTSSMNSPVYAGVAGELVLFPGHLLVGTGTGSSSNGADLSGDASTYPAAVDSVGFASELVFAGRMSGPFAFAFGATPTPGTGYFVVALDATTVAVKWAKVIGGTPIQDTSLGQSAAEGASIRLFASTSDLLFTVPFAGTLDLDGTMLTAPTGAQATAIFALNTTTGSVVWSKMYAKGPASSGKPSRPSAITVSGGTYELFDTVWDTMAFGGTTITATSGADVVIADLDATGNLLSYRLYGGPGDDEAYRIRSAPGGGYTILGHSMQSIDFGNGPLTTAAAEGELWLARVAP
jgi:outer membrane protein assembly factor BamB